MKGLRFVSFLAVALVLAACGATEGGGGTTNSDAGKPIKVGAILSLTGAGSVYGPQSWNGAALAVKQINGSGGVNGAKIALTKNDDASDKAQSAQDPQT